MRANEGWGGNGMTREGWPDVGDQGGGCIEGDSGLGVEGFGGLR